MVNPYTKEISDYANTLIHSRHNLSPRRLNDPRPSPQQLQMILGAAAAIACLTEPNERDAFESGRGVHRPDSTEAEVARRCVRQGCVNYLGCEAMSRPCAASTSAPCPNINRRI